MLLQYFIKQNKGSQNTSIKESAGAHKLSPKRVYDLTNSRYENSCSDNPSSESTGYHKPFSKTVHVLTILLQREYRISQAFLKGSAGYHNDFPQGRVCSNNMFFKKSAGSHNTFSKEVHALTRLPQRECRFLQDFPKQSAGSNKTSSKRVQVLTRFLGLPL